MALGRTTEGRSVASVGTTNASAAITGPASSFFASDVGRPISGTGIPAGATISAVASGTAATLSANATATGSITATLGAHPSGPNSMGLYGWSPETETEAAVHTLLGGGGVPAPSKPTNAFTSAKTRRGRG